MRGVTNIFRNFAGMIHRVSILTKCQRFLLLSAAILFTALAPEAKPAETTGDSASPTVYIYGYNNSGGKRVNLLMRIVNPTEFAIDSVRLVLQDTVYAPIQPFASESHYEPDSACYVWGDSIFFPFTMYFSPYDEVRVYTTAGGGTYMLNSQAVIYRESLKLLGRKAPALVTLRSPGSHLYIIIGAAVGFAVLLVMMFLRLNKRHRLEMIRIDKQFEESRQISDELRNKVEALYSERLKTFNALCDEYFNKRDAQSESVRLSLYNDIEKQILDLRNQKSIEELEDIVNKYLDNILVRLREQLPELGKKDIVFLTYLYSGFSPRAICVFTDIKIKNFYNKRSRLRDRILASGAPDREFFASKM